MYFVKGIIPELRNDEGLPNEKFLFKMQLIRLEDLEEAINKIFTDEAPPNLYFHNSSMARTIISQVELLSTTEQIPVEQYFTLKLASLFLIIGYIFDYEKPEEASINLMEEILPHYIFDDKYIRESMKLISNSFIENYPSLSDKILHDARFDYLGRNDYIRLTEKLFREKTERGMKTTMDHWAGLQIQFLTDHDFLTGTARLIRSVPIEEQVAALQIYNK